MILKHTHQLKRVKQTVRDGVPYLYQCADPHCTYRDEKKFLEGKASLCNNCRAEIILTREDLRRSKPLCMNCSHTKEAKAARELAAGIKELFPEEIEQ